ncbi:glycosyltransferase family 92 protein F13G3.3-like [Mercenaria mercenaria]|uniref:glycosyltransferase family 92 protein F13G3.3-like n=1 Tax=Mercenaria mercenaria TaxID=6596 RepID=UPI00234F7938|nr:glycosyltransferase family 92 protein F13G3.3-like [Mercenaria mercenaria]
MFGMKVNLKYSFNFVVFIGGFGLFLCLILTQNWLKVTMWTSSSATVTTSVHSRRNYIETHTMKKRSTWIDDFQHVTSEETMLVYSAYADGQTKVRIIGITNDMKADLLCILWYNSFDITTKLVKAYVADINESHGKSHTAAYFVCYLCDLDMPDAVSIVTFSTIHNPLNILPVHVNPQLKTQKHFTMCLSPMHSSFSDSSQLLEWIELHKILGVERFLIYVQSVSNDVKQVLKFYEKENNAMVATLPWSLSNDLCKNVILHYCGQLAALNDCLYRSKGYSYYIAATDLDEVIIPQHKDDFTWLDMLLNLPDHSVYLFRNSFAIRNLKNSAGIKENTPLMTEYLMRDDFIYEPRVRSKTISWTDDVVTLGIHNVWAMRSGDEYGVDPSVGLLHHYRKSPVAYPEGVHVSRLKSNVTVKYSRELRERVSLVREKMETSSPKHRSS